jgi:hypothetical protein
MPAGLSRAAARGSAAAGSWPCASTRQHAVLPSLSRGCARTRLRSSLRGDGAASSSVRSLRATQPNVRQLTLSDSHTFRLAIWAGSSCKTSTQVRAQSARKQLRRDVPPHAKSPVLPPTPHALWRAAGIGFFLSLFGVRRHRANAGSDAAAGCTRGRAAASPRHLRARDPHNSTPCRVTKAWQSHTSLWQMCGTSTGRRCVTRASKALFWTRQGSTVLPWLTVCTFWPLLTAWRPQQQDNTLTVPFATELDPRAASGLARLLEAFDGRAVLYSNSAGLQQYDPEGAPAPCSADSNSPPYSQGPGVKLVHNLCRRRRLTAHREGGERARSHSGHPRAAVRLPVTARAPAAVTRCASLPRARLPYMRRQARGEEAVGRRRGARGALPVPRKRPDHGRRPVRLWPCAAAAPQLVWQRAAPGARMLASPCCTARPWPPAHPRAKSGRVRGLQVPDGHRLRQPTRHADHLRGAAVGRRWRAHGRAHGAEGGADPRVCVKRMWRVAAAFALSAPFAITASGCIACARCAMARVRPCWRTRRHGTWRTSGCRDGRRPACIRRHMRAHPLPSRLASFARGPCELCM